MEIERKGKDIVLTCSEKEAGAIAAVLTYDLDDCASGCPFLETDICRITWNRYHWEACADLGEKIGTFLASAEVGKGSNHVHEC